ncbi:MAG: DMT family transporter [Cyanobacteriota bacterium]
MFSNPLVGLFFYSVMLTAGQALFKIVAQQSKADDHRPLAFVLDLFTTPTFLIACLLYALSTVIWVALLGRFPLSQAYPLVIAISIILTTTLGITFFKEPLTADKIFGLLLVGGGVKILSRSLS